MHFNHHLNRGNTTSLTGIVNVVANSVSLIDEEEEIEHDITNLFIYQSKIASSQDVLIPIGGGLFITQQEFTGDINDTRVPGLESILDYINTNFYDKTDPAINYNYYTIHKHLYNNDYTQNITNKIDNRKFINKYLHRFNETNNYKFQKTYNNTNHNYITNKNNIHDIAYGLTIKKDLSTKNFNNTYNNTYNQHIEQDNVLVKKNVSKTFNNTYYKTYHNNDNSKINNARITKNFNKK